MSIPRGIRNNNPGNIRKSANRWQGKIEPSTDTDFEQFISPEMGIRAIAKDLLTGYKRGEDTVREIISKWAPVGDHNDTAAYIAEVCGHMKVSPNDLLELDSYAVMKPLVEGIILQENSGQMPYSEEVMRAALNAAGVYDTPKAPMTQDKVAGIAKAAVATAGAVTAVNEQFQQTTMNMPWLGDLARFAIANQPKLVMLLAGVLVGVLIYEVWHRLKQREKGLS